MIFALKAIFGILYILFGAFNISSAIKDYHDERYFLCGVELMATAVLIAGIIDLIFR